VQGGDRLDERRFGLDVGVERQPLDREVGAVLQDDARATREGHRQIAVEALGGRARRDGSVGTPFERVSEEVAERHVHGRLLLIVPVHAQGHAPEPVGIGAGQGDPDAPNDRGPGEVEDYRAVSGRDGGDDARRGEDHTLEATVRLARRREHAIGAVEGGGRELGGGRTGRLQAQCAAQLCAAAA
jgi:hypothetical protein